MDIDELNNNAKEVIKLLYKEQGKSLTELKEKFDDFFDLQEEYSDYILVSSVGSGITAELTNEGEKAAEELLNISAPEVENIGEQAEEVLENDPLKYFLESVDKVFKGNHLLKIWELLTALSAKCSDKQISSWSIGSSLTGDTDIFVKKEDGWTIQSLRSLSLEFDGQDWKTLGLDSTSLKTKETPIKDVIHHKHQRKLVKIETKSGRTIEGTADHSFLKHKNNEVVPVTGEELEEGDYIPILNSKGLWEKKSQNNLNEAYVLGLYLAEGHRPSKNRIQITNEDSNVRGKLKKVCKKSNIDYRIRKSGDFSIDISSARKLFNEAKTGSGEKIVPSEVFVKSANYQQEVLKGYIDGDGTSGDSLGYTTKSKDLGEGISMLLSEFGIITTHSSRVIENYGRYYRYRITKPESERKFYQKIGFNREEDHKFDSEKMKQQYIDRIPIDSKKIARSLRKNRFDEEVSRNTILNNADEELGRLKLKEGLNKYDYKTETPYFNGLKKNLDSDIFWDKITNISTEDEKNHHRVYDIVAGGIPHFLLANGAIVHNSGSGKSSIKRKIIKYMPEESYMIFNSISSKALLYYTKKEGSDYFKNKLLFFDEVEASEEAVPILRSLTDPDGDQIRHMTVQEQEGQDIILEKPMAVWFTSVDLLQDEQLKNRFLITNPDSSKDLDYIVHKHQKNILHKGGDLDRIPKEAPIFREVVKDLRNNTYDLSLIVPYDIDWKQHFNRRLYPYFITLLELITKIYYRNREIRNEKIVATKADFQLAAKIWTELIETTIAQEDEEAIKIAQTLPVSRDKGLTTSEIAERLANSGTNKVRRKALNMIHTEDLNLVNGEKRSNRWHFWAGKDLDRLVNPEPEIIDDVDYMEHFIKSKVDIDYDDDLLDDIRNKETDVVDYLKEKGIDAGDLSSGRLTSRQLREFYPEDDPDGFDKIEEKAIEEYDIDEDTFFDMHQTLKDDGMIMSPKRGKWMQT